MDNSPFAESSLLITPQRRNDDPLLSYDSASITFIDREYRLKREAAAVRDSPSSKKQKRSCHRQLPTFSFPNLDDDNRRSYCHRTKLPTFPLPNLDDNRRYDRRGSQIATHSSWFEKISIEDNKANRIPPTSTTSIGSLYCTSTDTSRQRRYYSALDSSLPSCTLLPRRRPLFLTDCYSEESELLAFAPLQFTR
jgi:hypothetical protein